MPELLPGQQSIRFLFEDEALCCNAEGPIDGAGFATNARIIKADANRHRGVPGDAAKRP